MRSALLTPAGSLKGKLLTIPLLLGLLFFNIAVRAQGGRTITGTVVDSTSGNPIPGASIHVKGTKRGIAADVKGAFSITLPSDKSILVISSTGFTAVEIRPAGGTVNVRLAQSNQQMNDVVVVGYGVQKKATLTGAITTVSSKAFQDRGPIANPFESLQGQAPGVIVTRTSGQPGRENWNFQIRGISSTNSTPPLVILDGIALSDNSSLNTLNPMDIDNISFLKDASAAIYGARAANGVVLITTKRAKSGKPVIEYDASVSRKFTALMPHLLSIRQWGQGLMQATTNDNYGITPAPTSLWYEEGVFAANPPDSGYIDLTALPGWGGSAIAGLMYNGRQVPTFGDVKDLTYFNTNMQKILWGNANSTMHNLSFSGRNERSGYRVSLGYLNDGSQLQWGTNGSQRYNIRLNHDYSFSKAVKLETNISLERGDIQQPSLLTFTGYSALSNYGQPGMPALTKSGQPYEWGTVPSPPGMLKFGGANKTYDSRINAITNLTWNILDGLSFVGTAGYNTLFEQINNQQKQVNFHSYNDEYTQNPTPVAGLPNGNGTFYAKTLNRDTYYNFIGRLQYHKTLATDHEFSIMAGSSYERDEVDNFTTTTYDLADDNIPSLGLGVNSTVAGFVANAETQNHYALSSLFGRVTYSYKNKYLLEGLGRYDGTSKFTPDDRWKAFYGASVGWRISEEAFMQHQNIINDLKLRASYGEAGNQAGIGLYNYINLLNANSNQALLGTAPAVSVSTTGTLISLDQQWEIIKTKNLGVDFAVLKNRLSGSFDYFWKKNANMLLPQTVPAPLGAAAPTENIGDLETWGWEGMLTWRDNIGKDFTYSVSVNMTNNQDKLEHYGGASVVNTGFNNTVEGYPVGSYFGLRYAGRIQNQKQLDAYNAAYAPTGSTNNVGLPIPTPLASPAGQLSGLRPGDNMYKDVNGDGKLSVGNSSRNLGDLVYLGRDDPNYVWGFNLAAQWKGFDFQTIFQGVMKRTIWRNGSLANWAVPYGTVYQSQTNAWWGQTWSPQNPNAHFPNLHTGGGGINGYNYQASSWSVQNGAYVRLKNLVIGYTLPHTLTDRWKSITRLRFYVSGSDLWEHTHVHDGWDPEDTRTINGNERYPFYRYLTLGANLSF
ncbi:MAG TPA: TonB-dependent receptor [Puia sp.]|nr:TonB-dependent receptor [Puia sp.]